MTAKNAARGSERSVERVLDARPLLLVPMNAAVLNCLIEKLVQILIIWTLTGQRVMRYKTKDKLNILHTLLTNFVLCGSKEIRTFGKLPRLLSP